MAYCTRPFDEVVAGLCGISEDQYRKLQGMAAERHTSVNALVGDAVESLLTARPLKEDEVRRIKEALDGFAGSAMLIIDEVAELRSEL